MYPTQQPCALNGKPCPDFVAPDPTIYNSNSPFPAVTSLISKDATTFGYRIVTINICPFEYLPLQKKLFRYDQINVTIDYTIGLIEYQARISEKRNQITKDFVKSIVQNPTVIGNNTKTANQVVFSPATSINTEKLNIPWKPSLYGNIPDFVIITNNLLKPHFEVLANYKTQKGIPTVLVTVEQIYQNYAGVDNAEKVRNYLKSAHQFWGAGLFILLGGDTAVVPGRFVNLGYYGSNQNKYTDLYYSDVNKFNTPNYNWDSNNNGLYVDLQLEAEQGSDNFIGRLPVMTDSQVMNIVTKIMSYENLNGVTNKSYVNNMLFLGSYHTYFHSSNTGTGAGVYTSPYSSYSGQPWHYNLSVKPFLANSNLNKWLLFDDYLGNIPTQVYAGNNELNRDNTLSSLNTGHPTFGKYHLVSHYDHGNPFGVGTSGEMKSNSIFSQDFDDMTNGNYYQIMYSTSCSPAEFQLYCFGEHYVNKTDGGGVAFIGNSDTVSTGAEEQDNKLFHSIYGSLSPTSYLLGAAFANARDALPGEQRQRALTLLGEPTMATWSATPQNIILTVQQDLTINNAIANVLPVTINPLTEIATVTLYKFNPTLQITEVYASQTLAVGVTTTQFTVNPDTIGIMTVKVTAKNYLPANANVNILFPQAHLYVSGYNFVDANGNGFIEQGENVTLSVNLTNSGSTNITLVNTALSCNTLFGTVNNAAVSSAQIIAGQTVTLSGYTFTAANNNSLPNFIEFMINITANGGYVHLDNFFLELKNPVLTIGTRAMTNTIGTPISVFPLNTNNSLNITINNSGDIVSGTLTATLTSALVTSGHFAITNASNTYPSLDIFASKVNTLPFLIKLLQPHTGPKPFTLTLSNPQGKTWTFNFDLNEALPTLISGFKFASTKSEIKLIWNPVANIGGYNIYRSDTEVGGYSKINNFLVAGSSTYTDLNVTSATIYFYKIGVVSVSGNERPLIQLVTPDNPAKQGYKAWTSLDKHQAFPITASGSFRCYSAPTLYDVDNTSDHKKEIFSNLYKDGTDNIGGILGFKESGQEIFDIDGNPTSVSGFASTNIDMMSNAAVGDIDNDGHAEVFSTGQNDSTNGGKLYALKTVDNNNDNKPDNLWAEEAINFGNRIGRNPVLYDIDSNGFLDLIVADVTQKVYVYDKDRNLMPGWPIQVPGSYYSMGEIAVADLDHDGKAEIALGLKAWQVGNNKGAIFIWHHNGTPFTVNPFKEFANNEVADSGIVFADIDNDLNLDLLITTKFGSEGTSGKIYAFKQNGQPVNETWNGVNTFNTKNWTSSIPRISVGNLNHDIEGNLEIALGSLNKLYLFDKNGNNVPNFPKTTNDIWETVPIIADIDNDSDSEIIIRDFDKLLAFNIDGSDCIGFPIESSDGVIFSNAPSVDDIDNDGKNEIVISTLNATTAVYKTDGHSINNEWSSYRANSYNTGTYKEVCNNVLDLMVRDGADDLGTQPNTTTQYFWESDNIWVRNNNDNSLVHENPEFTSSGAPVFIKIRVVNKSCMTSTGNEQLNLYWSKASSGLAWPNSWNGSVQYPSTGASMGNIVGSLNVPVLQPGQEIILTFPWQVPNPYNYGGYDQWHFCLLSRIVASTDPMNVLETNDLVANVLNNNNIAWKNLTVVDVEPNNVVAPGGVFAVANTFNTVKNYYLELAVADAETGKPIYEEAEVGIKMDEILYNAWVRGGKGAQLLESTTEETRKIVKGNHVILDNINFNANEMGTLRLDFNFLTKELTNKSNYVYRVIQKDKSNGKIIGGETFTINKKPRTLFVADAGDDKIVDLNQPITISAVDINEPAIYNWYDNNGVLIFQGKNLQIANAVAEKYKLEVISTVDGFKDYSEMEVTINPNRLKNIIPNPVLSNATIGFNLNQASSAYIMVVNYYMNGSVSNNYVLDVNASETNINLSNYANGFYKVVLVVNGVISDAKIIFKQ